MRVIGWTFQQTLADHRLRALAKESEFAKVAERKRCLCSLAWQVFKKNTISFSRLGSR